MMKTKVNIRARGLPAHRDLPKTLKSPVFASVEEALARLAAEKPVYCLYPGALKRQTELFLRGFPGKTLFAVKSNPEADVLRLLYENGVRDFEVASRSEIDLVLETLGGVKLYFMNPVKARSAIRHAYSLGIRDFVFDCETELVKILEETGKARDLNLYLRLSVDNAEAALDLSSKFGAHQGEDTANLLKLARENAKNLGVCFHVGSQCTAPSAFRKAFARIRALLNKTQIAIEMIDVGGGFPAPYPGFRSLDLGKFFDAIKLAAKDFGFENIPLMCEPGRALVAEAGSVLARVELRKGQALYLNEGTYGSLFDAGTLSWRYPARLVAPKGARTGALQKFSFFGPTCDSLDAMPGPFLLPGSVKEGDWIEIQNIGGYGTSMRTDFNGFKSNLFAIIQDSQGDRPEFTLSPVEKTHGE